MARLPRGSARGYLVFSLLCVSAVSLLGLFATGSKAGIPSLHGLLAQRNARAETLAMYRKNAKERRVYGQQVVRERLVPVPNPLNVFWMKECGCTGMHEEAVTLLYAIDKFHGSAVHLRSNKCSESCGRPHDVQEVIDRIERMPDVHQQRVDVLVVHYAFKGVCGLEGAATQDMYVISRTMFETDGLERSAVERCNSGAFEEIWLPSKFNLQTFSSAGVDRNKMRIIPEALNTDLYNPDPPKGWDDILTGSRYLRGVLKKKAKFNFYSNFKWEQRKNWKGLLTAFAEEFDCKQRNESVALFLKTYKAWEGDPAKDIPEFFAEHDFPNRCEVVIISKRLSSRQLAFLYADMDAFVLPTHGEGWGLPTMEAMAMEMPVITTDWGGTTQFANSGNAFMLPVSNLTWAFGKPKKKQKWAEPSVQDLRKAMRQVMSDPALAKRKGKQAREDIEINFGLQPVADIIAHRLNEIRVNVPAYRHRKHVAALRSKVAKWSGQWGETELWEKIGKRLEQRHSAQDRQKGTVVMVEEQQERKDPVVHGNTPNIPSNAEIQRMMEDEAKAAAPEVVAVGDVKRGWSVGKSWHPF